MRVVFLTNYLMHYRVAFHERVRANLMAEGVVYDLVYGAPEGDAAKKGDTTTLPWGTRIANRTIKLPKGAVMWQPALKPAGQADLLVLGQENKHLINYLYQSTPAALRPRLAFFGHGRNHQADRSASPAELWKRAWAKRVDWWFGYTEATRAHLVSLGYPAARITVVNNAIDTAALQAQAAAVTPERLAARRAELGLQDGPVGVYVGSLYKDKRVDFLIRACDETRRLQPGFQLLILGGGAEAQALREIAAHRPWVHLLGPRFGADKAELMSLAQVFLIPSLVGLAVLDAGVFGLPMITTDHPGHGPEFAYLEDGVSGLVIRPSDSQERFGAAVAQLLAQPEALARMSAAARANAARYTVEAMADNFSKGALAALAAPYRSLLPALGVKPRRQRGMADPTPIG